MANTLKLGAGKWATGTDTVLAFNDENNNFKPLPFDFSRASSATVVNQSGLIETVGSGEPRIDFQGNTKGALLLEPQRSNLVTYSELFSAWSISSNAILTYESDVISPDGTSGVYRLNLPATSATFIASNAISISSVGTFSCYVKSANTGNNDFGFYKGSGSIPSPFTATNEWQRFELNVDSSTVNMAIINGADTFASDIYIWGAQAEEGSYATSYIPTSGSAVTRVVDACSQTTPDGVIGQTEGTFLLEFERKDGDYGQPIWLSDGSYQNYTYFVVGNTDTRFVGKVPSGVEWNIVIPALSKGVHKIAGAYKQNDIVFYVDGVKKGEDTSANIPPCNLLGLGYENGTIYNNSDPYNQVKIYNTRLSNSELAALTTI